MLSQAIGQTQLKEEYHSYFTDLMASAGMAESIGMAQTCWPNTGFNLNGKDLSMLSMESAEDPRRRQMSFDISNEKIDSVKQLVKGLDTIFKHRSPHWCLTQAAITSLLESVDLTTDEVNKYTFWDSEKPYTRNLISTDNSNYTLLLLCWNPGKESKIHNHPCDGCFVKTIRGCIRESRYSVHSGSNEIRLDNVRFYNEGQVRHYQFFQLFFSLENFAYVFCVVSGVQSIQQLSAKLFKITFMLIITSYFRIQSYQSQFFFDDFNSYFLSHYHI